MFGEDSFCRERAGWVKMTVSDYAGTFPKKVWHYSVIGNRNFLVTVRHPKMDGYPVFFTDERAAFDHSPQADIPVYGQMRLDGICGREEIGSLLFKGDKCQKNRQL